MSDVRKQIANMIGIELSKITQSGVSIVDYAVLSSTKEDGYIRQYISYTSGTETVPAYLLLPDVLNNNPAVLIHHQHNREHHLGKSEVCGL